MVSSLLSTPPPPLQPGEMPTNLHLLDYVLQPENFPILERVTYEKMMDTVERGLGKKPRLGPTLRFQSELQRTADGVFQAISEKFGVTPSCPPNVYFQADRMTWIIRGGSVLAMMAIPSLASQAVGLSLENFVQVSLVALPFASPMLFVPVPHSGLYGHFDHFRNGIMARRRERIPVRVSLAHEYAHKLQHERRMICDEENILKFNHLAFLEGHAMGIERWAAEHDPEDPQAGTAVMTEIDACRLHHLYFLIAAIHGKTPAESIVEISDFVDYDATSKFHNLGCAAFLMAESKHGPDIYRRALAGDYDFFAMAPEPLTP